MKHGIVISQTEPDTVFNALRLANYGLKPGDAVNIFLVGKGVELDQINDVKFNVREQAKVVLDAGGQFLACGTSGAVQRALCRGRRVREWFLR